MVCIILFCPDFKFKIQYSIISDIFLYGFCKMKSLSKVYSLKEGLGDQPDSSVIVQSAAHNT